MDPAEPREASPDSLAGESTIKGTTADDWLDPCVSCYGVIRTDKLKTEECGHSYHSNCHRKWFAKAKSCPLCSSVKLGDRVRSAFKCPLCSVTTRRDDWIRHCSDKHRVIRCKKCKEVILFHNRGRHARIKCVDPSLIPLGCPAFYCTVKVSVELAERGTENPRLLIKDHKCKEVIECAECEECFLETDQYRRHLLESSSGVDHSNMGPASRAGTKRKRKAVEEGENVKKKIAILEKKGVFEKLDEDLFLMSRKRLMQIIEEHEKLFK